jgi:hypothetical protein
MKLTLGGNACILEAMPSVPVFNSLEASRDSAKNSAARLARARELQARQPRCVRILKTGVKCEGMAQRGGAWCFNHDPSPEGKAARALRNAHASASSKLRYWELRQVRVAALNPAAAFSLGYAPMHVGQPWRNRKQPVEI